MPSPGSVPVRLALLVSLAGSAIVAGATSADAGAASCQGQAVTLVGTPGGEVTGTDGPDVIVTNGAFQTSAGAGDDLVCVTGGSGVDNVTVQGGDGNDSVEATQSEATRTSAFLEQGDDTFTGGAEADFVVAGDRFERPRAEGTDVVSTGAGHDVVETGGSLVKPDHDSIDLGPGRDLAWIQGPVDAAHPIEAGSGSDILETDGGTLHHALAFDNTTGQATDAGVPVMSWSSVERFRLGRIGTWEAPSFVGGAASESVTTYVPLTSASLGGGDDHLRLDVRHAHLVDEASFRGGRGEDSFMYPGATWLAKRIRLDLPAHRLDVHRAHEDMQASIGGFEVHRLAASRLDVRGSAGSDQLLWTGCRGDIDAGPGDDLVVGRTYADFGCSDGRLVVRGGAGSDRLVGNREHNVLLGGSGDDFANGRGAFDRCSAETVEHCELQVQAAQ